MTDAPPSSSNPSASNAPVHTPAQPPKTPQFPPHNAPRVWLLTNGASPISINLARHLLAHGDYVVTCVSPWEIEKEERRGREFGAFWEEIRRQGSKSNTKMKPWKERVRVVPLDVSSVSQAQAAVAEALSAFGMGIDILLLTTPSAVLGTVEELSQTPATVMLVRDQFEINFFANVNLIKAVLPAMRERKNGHIVLLSGITGHLGTPGLATHCASQWAIEGYCDSLAYEIAPFNVKMTVVQPNIEIGILTNRITSVPPMAEYAPDTNPAPFSREIFAGLLDKLEGAVMPTIMMDLVQTPVSTTTTSGDNADVGTGLTTGDLLSSPSITSLYAPLSTGTQTNLVAETVFALAAIGGHDNPPARHIVGFEGVASVKEKLKTVSEELEDFIEVSAAVDFTKEEGDAMTATVPG
ncbi:NAD(P)-binding protein [Rhizodiscina lignyota]|uniref:NAD(P)-binding protein n=1 Tax=Rhizodiscina lignyota TaxID=1504668 RepID=A0A9P4IBM5_9PEZI|nr:NAD(P)-binding protein [Rhizodiscina lignyota]